MEIKLALFSKLPLYKIFCLGSGLLIYSDWDGFRANSPYLLDSSFYLNIMSSDLVVYNLFIRIQVKLLTKEVRYYV